MYNIIDHNTVSGYRVRQLRKLRSIRLIRSVVLFFASLFADTAEIRKSGVSVLAVISLGSVVTIS